MQTVKSPGERGTRIPLLPPMADRLREVEEEIGASRP
jgi:hypothetical protein